MTVYARSDLQTVTVGAEGFGGCGTPHHRPGDGLWGLDCPDCEQFLRSDPLWSATPAEIPMTHDEAKAVEQWEKDGARQQSALLAASLAQLAGFTPAQIPPHLQKMISGLAPHIPVAGQMECPAGHLQPPGARFCSDCGQSMSAPAATASLPAGSQR